MINTDKKIIETIFEDIITKGEFPKFGSPTMKCNECMFYGIACYPSSDCVGCFGGWKREAD